MKWTVIILFTFLLATSAWAGILRDDFSDGNYDGWTVWNYFGGDSVWKVESGRLRAERQKEYAASVILDNSIGWKDYEVGFDVMIEQSLATSTFVIIGVRVSGNSNNTNHIGPALAYKWEFGAINQGVIYAKSVKGANDPEIVSFGEHHYPVELQKYYRLKLTAIGSKFRLYIDDVLHREFTLNGYESGGVLMGAAGCIAYFDNVVITGEDVPDMNLSVTPRAKLATTWRVI